MTQPCGRQRTCATTAARISFRRAAAAVEEARSALAAAATSRFSCCLRCSSGPSCCRTSWLLGSSAAAACAAAASSSPSPASLLLPLSLPLSLPVSISLPLPSCRCRLVPPRNRPAAARASRRRLRSRLASSVSSQASICACSACSCWRSDCSLAASCEHWPAVLGGGQAPVTPCAAHPAQASATAGHRAAPPTRGVAQPSVCRLQPSRQGVDVIGCGLRADGFQRAEAHDRCLPQGSIPAAGSSSGGSAQVNAAWSCSAKEQRCGMVLACQCTCPRRPCPPAGHTARRRQRWTERRAARGRWG